MQTLKITIRGTTPLLMHNERLVNPFDPMTRAIGALTSKRKKTDEDRLEVARLEHEASLYMGDSGPVVPGWNLFACIVEGGKLHKLGTAIKRAALMLDTDIPLQYEGPKTPACLYGSPEFVDMRAVKVGQQKVLRCRPIFKRWGLSASLVFDAKTIQRDELVRCISDAGQLIGLGDYRPRFGRFALESAE